MRQTLKARGAILTMCMATVSTPALAHQSLAPHTHPHGESWLLGLDLMAIVGLGAAGLLALAAVLWTRAVRAKMRKAGTGTNPRRWL